MNPKYYFTRFNTLANEWGFSNRKKIGLFCDWLGSFLRWRTTIHEYFMYEFYEKNAYARSQYMMGYHINRYYKDNNDAAFAALLDNKEETLMMYAEFVNRDWVGQKYHSTREEYDAFFRKHTRFIVKPLDGMAGHGVRLVEAKDFADADAFCDFMKKNRMLAEEVVIQNPAMAAMYPHGINTVRVLCQHNKIIAAVLRMGTGGAVIDNAHSGGIFAEMDVDLGMVVTPARTIYSPKFVAHPDTKTPIIGFKVPKWNEIVDFVNRANEKNKDLKMAVIGYDIALSEKGVTLIEANSNPAVDIIQAPSRTGRKYFFSK